MSVVSLGGETSQGFVYSTSGRQLASRRPIAA